MTVEEGSPLPRENDAPSAVLNEASTPRIGVFSLGHRAIRAGVGTVFLGLDQVNALLGHAVKRGEQVEAAAQRVVADLRRETVNAAHAVTSSASRRSTAAWSSGLASVLSRVPGVSLAYKKPQSTSRPAAGEVAQKSVAQVTINDCDAASQQND